MSLDAYSPAGLPVPVAVPSPDPFMGSPTDGLFGNMNEIGNSDTSMDNEISTLKSQGYATGLASALVRSNRANHPIRIWVVDNSGSMSIGDGTCVADGGGPSNFKTVSCSRWEELRDTVEYHAQLAELISAPTSFRLLNNTSGGSPEFSVGKNIGDAERAKDIMMGAMPGGATPLVEHIQKIRSDVLDMAPGLRAKGQQAVIVIATDGLPTDSYGQGGAEEQAHFTSAMRSLEGLPVWVVVRLCTDAESVREFYNDLDSNLELSLEVIDDFVSEAVEVHRHNPWLNYCLPLHRAREFGVHDNVFDHIDERRLQKRGLRDLCVTLFGDEGLKKIDPDVNWKEFSEKVAFLVEKEGLNYSPVKKKEMPWINIKKMNKMYGPSRGCVLM